MNLVHSKVLLNKVNLRIVLVVVRFRVSKIFCEFDALGGVFITRQTYVSTLYKLRYYSAQVQSKRSFIQGKNKRRPCF